jgi:MFS family permease
VWRVIPADPDHVDAVEARSALEAASSGPLVEDQDSGYKWRLLGVIGLAVAGFGSLMTLVTVSLAAIAADLETSTSTAAWILTGLMLAMAVGTPLGGKFGDMYGYKRVFVIGLAGMTVTILLSAVAPSIEILILLRVLFGVAGAMLMPTGMALMMQAFGPTERARALGWFQFAMTGAPTIGVVVGGPLIDLIGWRGVFFAFGVISLLSTVTAMAMVKPIPASGGASIDWLGAGLLGAATLCVLVGITRMASVSRAGEVLWGDNGLWMLAGSAVALYVIFVKYELRQSAPLLDVRLFAKRSFSLPLLASTCSQFSYMGAFVIVPGILQGPYGYTVGASALLMIPRPGVFALASPLGGSLVGKVGERIPMLIGSVCMVASMAAFALGSQAGGLVFIIAGLVLSGVSAGIASPAYQTLVANSVDDKDLGIANGMNQTAMWMGMIMGIQSMIAISGDVNDHRRVVITFIFAGLVAAVGFVAPLAMPRGRAD